MTGRQWRGLLILFGTFLAAKIGVWMLFWVFLKLKGY